MAKQHRKFCFAELRWSVSAVIAGTYLAAALASQPLETEPPLSSGVVHRRVVCADNPEFSYALYLPSAYTPERFWPVIYAFDPMARGALPVELLKDAAEKYGYIVAGSNDARNFGGNRVLEAVNAMSRDTTRRFRIDPRRVYLTGFSGGARLAAMLAWNCNGCAAGVLGHGAGFMAGHPPREAVNFVYYGTVGDLDFNYPEMLQLSGTLDELGVPNRLSIFEGPHNWPPPDVWMEAVEWLELQAMQRGLRPRDDVFLDAQLSRARDRLQQFERAGDLYAVYNEARKLSQDFAGLVDVSEFEQRAAALAQSDAVREGRERLQKQIEQHDRLLAPPSQALFALRGAPAERQQLVFQIRRAAEELRRNREREKDSEQRKVYERVLNALFAQTIEEGQRRMAENDFRAAEFYFDLVTSIRPEAPGPYLWQARARAQRGDKNGAIRALEQAAERGLRSAEFFRNDTAMAPLRDHPNFQKFLARLDAKP